MHEWHTNKSYNPLTLINEFTGFEYNTDHSGRLRTKGVKVVNRMFASDEDAINFVTNQSYYSDYAYMAAYTTSKKLSKGYQNAYNNFFAKYNEYLNFSDSLTVAYGRTSTKATCPNCGSSISLKYGNRFKACPVCGSGKIISDSNWKTLETKKRMSEKAAENLAKEAEKNGVLFVCGMEWHC